MFRDASGQAGMMAAEIGADRNAISLLKNAARAWDKSQEDGEGQLSSG